MVSWADWSHNFCSKHCCNYHIKTILFKILFETPDMVLHFLSPYLVTKMLWCLSAESTGPREKERLRLLASQSVLKGQAPAKRWPVSCRGSKMWDIWQENNPVRMVIQAEKEVNVFNYFRQQWWVLSKLACLGPKSEVKAVDGGRWEHPKVWQTFLTIWNISKTSQEKKKLEFWSPDIKIETFAPSPHLHWPCSTIFWPNSKAVLAGAKKRGPHWTLHVLETRLGLLRAGESALAKPPAELAVGTKRLAPLGPWPRWWFGRQCASRALTICTCWAAQRGRWF